MGDTTIESNYENTSQDLVGTYDDRTKNDMITIINNIDNHG